jgi:hypothetical protein
MKKALVRSGVVVVLLLPVAAADKPGELTNETQQKVRALAEERDSGLMDILLPEQALNQTVPVASLPQTVTADAESWIRKVVRSKWLPSDISGRLVAAKDLKLLEKKDPNGIAFMTYEGDFLLLDFEVAGHAIHVQESGGHVSIRVDLPQPIAIEEDPPGAIRRCLAEFLNIPADELAALDLQVERHGPLYAVFMVWRPPPSPVPDSPDGEVWNHLHWWERLTVCTDGRFFFVCAPEREPGYYKPQAKPGLRDRF